MYGRIMAKTAYDNMRSYFVVHIIYFKLFFIFMCAQFTDKLLHCGRYSDGRMNGTKRMEPLCTVMDPISTVAISQRCEINDLILCD